jgi:hypothetical protein
VPKKAWIRSSIRMLWQYVRYACWSTEKIVQKS